jgi:hypothetical protein
VNNRRLLNFYIGVSARRPSARSGPAAADKATGDCRTIDGGCNVLRQNQGTAQCPSPRIRLFGGYFAIISSPGTGRSKTPQLKTVGTAPIFRDVGGDDMPPFFASLPRVFFRAKRMTMIDKSKFALSLLFEMAQRFYHRRAERALMRFAPTRCSVVLPATPRGMP